MKQKSTLSGFWKSSIKPLGLAIVMIAGSNTVAQQLYSNGGLTTGPTSNSLAAAPSGYTWSEVQNESGNTTESNTNAGFGAIFNTAGTNSLQLAEDFTVPVGQEWVITSLDFFGYQTGFTGVTVPIDQLRVQIWNGNPSLPGSTAVVVAGDMTTNALNTANSAEALMYRIFNSATPAPGTPIGTTRKIWRFNANLSTTLQPGTYWVVYQVHAINDGNVFFPSVTVAGTRGLAGWNARQNTIASTGVGAVLGWTNVIDAGTPATAADIAQDMPFNVNGTFNLGVANNALSGKVSIYPNPAVSVVNISAAYNILIDSAVIYDISGKVVKSVNPSVAGIQSIAVSELMTGNYVIKMKSGNDVIVKNFIKE